MNNQSDLQIPVLSPEDKEDLQYVIDLAKPGEALVLNFADEKQYRFYKRQLELAGETPAQSPQLFKTLEESRTLHRQSGPPPVAYMKAEVGSGETQVINIITQLGSNDGQSFCSAALSSVPGGTTTSMVTLGLYDADQTPIGSVQEVKQFNDGKDLTINADGQFDTPMPPEGRTVVAIATYSYETPDQSEPVYQTLTVNTAFSPQKINNDDPAQKIQHPSYPNGLIKIALNRMHTYNDCDYYETISPPPVNVVFPVKGSIVYFNDIDPIEFDGDTPTNAMAVITVTRNQAGGGGSLIESHNFFKDPNTQVEGNTLSWSLDPAQFGAPFWISGQYITYTFSVYVTIQGKAIWAFVTNADKTRRDQNTWTIPPMEIVWGCLAGDVRVRMADGSEKPIETIEVQEKIIADNRGTFLTVENTTTGIETKPLIRIKDDQGHSLLLTEGHAVVAKSGILLAKQLQPGDEVITESGTARLTAVEREPYQERVWNLDVGISEDGVALGEDNTTFFANGILVGDGKMQRIYGLRYETHRDTVLKIIPEKWHQDYLNYLESKKL